MPLGTILGVLTIMGLSWERLIADYNVLEGGLLPLGMLVLLVAPLIARKLREA